MGTPPPSLPPLCPSVHDALRRVFLSDEKILGCYHPLVAEDVVNLAEVMTALVR